MMTPDELADIIATAVSDHNESGEVNWKGVARDVAKEIDPEPVYTDRGLILPCTIRGECPPAAADEAGRLADLSALLSLVADVDLWRDHYPDGPDVVSSAMIGKRQGLNLTPDMVRAARSYRAGRLVPATPIQSEDATCPRVLGTPFEQWAAEADLDEWMRSLFEVVSAIATSTVPGGRERALDLIKGTHRAVFEDAFYRGRRSAIDNPPATPTRPAPWAIQGSRKHADGHTDWIICEGVNAAGDGPNRTVGYFDGSRADAERIARA